MWSSSITSYIYIIGLLGYCAKKEKLSPTQKKVKQKKNMRSKQVD